MKRSVFDVVMEAAAAVVEAGPSARPFRPYPRSEDRAPVVKPESVAAAEKPPRDYSLPAERVRTVKRESAGLGNVVVVLAARKGSVGK